MAELFLVRHAQASFHGADYDELSEHGHRQSRWLGEYWQKRGAAFDALVCGTLRRHQQTLEGISAALPGIASARRSVLPGLDEYDFRALVQSFAKGFEDHPQVRAWRAAPSDKPAFYRVLRLAMLAWGADELPAPPDQSWQQFSDAVEDAAVQLQVLADKHERILAVSSGGAIATLLGARLELPIRHIVDLNMQMRNTSISHFYLNSRRFVLSSWNAVPHLEDAGRHNAITYG